MNHMYQSSGSSVLLRRLIAIGLSIILAALYALVASSEGAGALYAFFVSPFSSRYALLSMIERSAPILLCAVGACLALKAGAFNLGGEGQAAFGALAAAITIRITGTADLPSFLVVIMAMAAALISGAALAWVSAAAETWSGADIMLTSFLISQGTLVVVDWCVGTAFRDESSNLLAMTAVPVQYRLVLGNALAPLSLASLFSLSAAIGGWFILRGTRFGMYIDLSGKNPVFARAVGVPKNTKTLSMVLSGALGALAGACILLGQTGRAVKGMTGGVGWDGFSVALVAGSNPIASVPTALFFAWLDAGSRQGSLLADLSPDAGAIMKAAALFLITATAIGVKRKKAGPK